MTTAVSRSVSDVIVTRTSDTSVMVSWEGLTLLEARGFPFYLVLLKTDSDESGDITKLTSNTSTVVIDVEPATAYEVSVTVYTGTGLDYGAESERGGLPHAGIGIKAVLVYSLPNLTLLIEHSASKSRH